MPFTISTARSNPRPQRTPLSRKALGNGRGELTYGQRILDRDVSFRLGP